MYEVFIDNKCIVFCEKHKNTKKNENFIIIHVNEQIVIPILKLREELPASVLLIVESIAPEETLLATFSTFKMVEAAGGIVRRKNKFLFIERHGLWDIPKGKMEKGELPGSTAVREIEEECGIVGPVIMDLIGITFHTYTYKEKPTLKKNWWFALSYDGTKKVSPQLEEAITQAVWLKKSQWKEIIHNTYPSIVNVLEKADKIFG